MTKIKSKNYENMTKTKIKYNNESTTFFLDFFENMKI